MSLALAFTNIDTKPKKKLAETFLYVVFLDGTQWLIHPYLINYYEIGLT